MKFPGVVVFFILFGLFLASIGARVATTSRTDSPYFTGVSAMNYRHADGVANGLSPRAHHTKANHPDGYTPARIAAPGSEYAAGWVIRVARFFGESDPRTVTRRFVVFLSALCVFFVYGVVRRLWDCQAAGLLSAGLVAFLPPLVALTNGRTFTHEIVAAPVLGLHALLVLRALAARSRVAIITAATLAALAAYLLLAVWEAAALVLGLWVIMNLLWRPLPRSVRVALVTAHVAAAAVAVATLPHLTSGEAFPVLTYAATRLRFLLDKPATMSMLSEWMRHVWSLDHAPLTPQAAIQLFIPLVLLMTATAINPECRARRGTFVVSAAVALAAAAVALLDRAALPIAAIAMIPMATGCARSLGRDLRVRLPIVILGAYCAFAGVAFREKGPDIAFQITRTLDVAYRDPDAFLWISLENTDRELVRFVSTRTSVRESILAPQNLSALLVAFSGRTSVLLPGGNSRATAEKRVRLTRDLYGGEEALRDACRELKIDYVLYSIDVLLDSGRYSPRYLAGVERLDPECVAFGMHFEPESLRFFTLIYENDHYRLFKVTDRPETIFLTDHPPVYQGSLLNASGGGLETFYQNTIGLLYNYGAGVRARSSGDLAGALQRLRSCVAAAPRFTKARLALADVFMDLERFEDARKTIMDVIAYAPDNSQAMYYAAYIHARLGDLDQARGFLAVLLSHERSPDLLEKARLLQAYMDQGLPLEPSAPDAQ